MKLIIERQEGKINEIVYDQTVFHAGRYHFYLPLMELDLMIVQIIASNVTTEYVRMIPFYRNQALDRQLELDEYMFFISCQDNFSEEEYIEYLSNNIGKEYHLMSPEEKKWAKIRFPLCKTGDIMAYQAAWLRFKAFLPEYILFLFEKAKKELKLKEKDIPFGYFCFEINSE
ncbi:MAG: hypothetical protein ACRC6X_02780 [Culicoidibacterales bacterium]